MCYQSHTVFRTNLIYISPELANLWSSTFKVDQILSAMTNTLRPCKECYRRGEILHNNFDVHLTRYNYIYCNPRVLDERFESGTIQYHMITMEIVEVQGNTKIM